MSIISVETAHQILAEFASAAGWEGHGVVQPSYGVHPVRGVEIDWAVYWHRSVGDPICMRGAAHISHAFGAALYDLARKMAEQRTESE